MSECVFGVYAIPVNCAPKSLRLATIRFHLKWSGAQCLVHSGCAFMITIEPLGTCNTINTTVSLMNFNFFVLCFPEPFYGSFYDSKNAK